MWRDGVVEAVLDAGQLAEHRVAADVQPRVVDDARASARPRRGPRAARAAVAGRDRGARGEERVRGLVPRPVEPVVERARCGRSAPARAPTRRGGRRRRRGSRRSAPARSTSPAIGQLARLGDVPRGRARGGRSTPRSTPRAAARRPGRGRRGVAGGVERGQDPLRAAAVAEHDPRPAEPVDDREREQRVVRGAPGQRGVDVRALGPGEGEVLGLARAAHARGRRRGRAPRTTRRARRGARSVSPASAIASSANARMLSSSR